MASIAVILFVAGAVLGSFITVVAHRLPRDRGFVSGRSECPSCGAVIGARDNIPVASWMLLRGRCRSCGERISIRYPLTEAGLGALWVATYLILGDDDAGVLALGLVLCALLVAVTLTDLDLRTIPNRIVAFGAVLGIAILVTTDPDSLTENLISAAIAGGVLFARHGPAARKRAIPFGPFLALGGVVALWFGNDIVDWYLDEFFPN
jgi:leader peptidase (prepilin peptidase)/N-methyltransferase